MPVKMTGKQFKAWLASDWGPEAMWEDEHYTVNGAEVLDELGDFDTDTIADTDKVVLTDGTIITDQNIRNSPTIAAVAHAKKWLKEQTTVTLLVEVPREAADAIEGMIGGLSVKPGGAAKVVGRMG